MATRKKKKQRTMQLMASAALLSTTVAPYVISAEELTNNPLDLTNDTQQNMMGQIVTQTTGDSASISSGHENTIDNESEIISSGGNTSTESIDNGIPHSTTVTGGEAINNASSVAPAAEVVTDTQTDVIWRQSVNYTMQADPNGPMADFITNYLNPYFSNAEVVQVGNAYYMQLTLTGKAYGFAKLQYIDNEGTYHDIDIISSEGEKLDQVRVVRLPLIQDENGISKIFVDSGDLGYGAYTLFFNFDIPELPELQPTETEQPNDAISISHSFTSVEVQPGIYGSVGGGFIDNYLKPYFTNAQLVTIDGKKYIEMTLIGKGYGVVSFEGATLVSSVGEKMNQVRVFRIPAAKVSTHEIDAGDYGIYDLTFTFDVTDEQLATPVEPEQPTTPDIVEENVYFLTEYSNASYGTFIGSTIKSANFITRNNEQFAHVFVKPSAQASLDTNGDYTVIDTLEDGTLKLEIKVTDSKATIPFLIMGKMAASATLLFPAPLAGTVIEENRPFAITAASDTHYTKIYTAATEKIDIIEKEDGQYARIFYSTDYPTFKTIKSGTVVSFTENSRIIEVKLDEAFNATVEFANATGSATHTVTYNVREAIESEKLPAPYEGIASYLDVEEKTDVRFKYTADSDAEAIEALEQAVVVNPYVNRVEQQIQYGMQFEANEQLTKIELYTDNILAHSWTSEEKIKQETLVNGALGHLSFKLTFADGTEKTVKVSAIVAGSFAKQLPAAEVIEENVSFTFETGDSTINNYMKSYINKANIVKVGEQLFADVTLTGNTYAYTHIKFNDTLVDYASNGKLGKELERIIRIPLDDNKQSVVAMNGGGHNNTFTFNFNPAPKVIVTSAADLTANAQAVAFEYSATTAWHVAAFPSNVIAASAKAVDGKMQVTLQVATEGLNSFVVKQHDADIATWSSASSLVTFTVDSLDNIVFDLNKTSGGRTSSMTVNVEEMSVSPDGALPAETVVVNPEQPTNPDAGDSGHTTTTDDTATVTPGDGSGNTTNPDTGNGSGNATNPETGNNSGNATNPETGNNSGNATKPETPTTVAPIDITHSFTATEVKAGIYGSVGGDFIENYLKPYFTNAQLVTVDGKKYIEMTLIGKGYGVVSFEHATLVSSVGEKMDQVRVFRIPAAKVSTHEIDAGDYGIYDLTFTFGVTDEQLADAPGENTTPTTPVTPAPITPDIPAPKAPAVTTNEIVKDISKFKLNTATPISFTVDTTNELAKMVSQMIKESKAKRISATQLEITFKIEKKPTIKRITFFQNGKEIKKWETAKMSRIASLLPFFANTTEDVTLNVASTEGITFEVEETNGTVTTIGTAIEAKKADLAATTTVKPAAPGGGNVITGNFGTVTNRESISYKMVGDPNGPMADFMTNYMNPFFSNAELVTVDGKNYIEMTLTGKAYGFQNLRVTGGYKVISSEGEKMDQVRVIRFPANKNVTIHVDSGELGYGAYDLLFTFDLSEEQMKNAAAAGTGGITPVQTVTPQIVSEGDVKFTIPAASSAIVTYAKKISSKLVDGKYNVSLTLMTETDLETFVVKQGDKEIARWDKKAKSASLAKAANSNVLTFTVESIEELTLIATTKNRTLEAKLLGEPVKKEEVVPQVTKDGRTPMSYTMEADPNGPMADFISGYLAPYFSNAVYVLEDGKEYVELTLTGKAYGFQKLQYIDADGKNVDIEVVSSKGEKMDQVRVVRLPLIQDKDGITKIFVDSGDLGYGAYTLFFKFNVPAKSANTETAKPAVANPFKDIDGVYSKDDILALYAAGITTGTTETTYSPNANMTRAQFAVMIARTLGISSTNETKFKDVQGKWYAKEVQALTEIGIIQGVSDTKFKPGDKITRQQAAIMIHRMLAHKGYTNKATMADLNFKDSAKISDYAKEAFAELQAQGIMTGYEGKVNPTQNLTRAQMAKILKNAADLVGLLD